MNSSALAADIEGIHAVLDFFERVQAETNGTFRAEVLDLVADEHTVFCRPPMNSGPTNEKRESVNMYVNGDDVRYSSGMNTPVNDNDEILILPTISGG